MIIAKSKHKQEVREFLLTMLITYGREHEARITASLKPPTFYHYCLQQELMVKREIKEMTNYVITDKGLEFIHGNGI